MWFKHNLDKKYYAAFHVTEKPPVTTRPSRDFEFSPDSSPSNKVSILHTIASQVTLRKKATIHQVTTMLASSKIVLFPCHNHLLTTGLIIAQAPARVIIKVKGHQYRWLADGNDLGKGHFRGG